MATHSSILAWRIPMNRGAWQALVHTVTKGWTRQNQLGTHAHMAGSYCTALTNDSS